MATNLMYIIYNQDGSIKEKNFPNYVNQGSSNVNRIFVAIDGEDNTDYSVSGVFKLPNNDTSSVAFLQGSEKLHEDDEENTSGYYYDLTEAQTYYAGILLLSINAIYTLTQNLFTYTAKITVNSTTYEAESDNSDIINGQYNSLVAALNTKMERANTYSKTEANALFYAKKQIIIDVNTSTTNYDVGNNTISSDLMDELFDNIPLFVKVRYYGNIRYFSLSYASSDELDYLQIEENITNYGNQNAIYLNDGLVKFFKSTNKMTITAFEAQTYTQTYINTELGKKENTSNKTTTLSSSSTDTQYPSAKCVFDNLENVREVAEGKLDYIYFESASGLTIGDVVDAIALNDSGSNFVKINSTIYIVDSHPTHDGYCQIMATNTISNAMFYKQDIAKTTLWTDFVIQSNAYTPVYSMTFQNSATLEDIARRTIGSQYSIYTGIMKLSNPPGSQTYDGEYFFIIKPYSGTTYMFEIEKMGSDERYVGTGVSASTTLATIFQNPIYNQPYLVGLHKYKHEIVLLDSTNNITYYLWMTSGVSTPMSDLSYIYALQNFEYNAYLTNNVPSSTYQLTQVYDVATLTSKFYGINNQGQLELMVSADESGNVEINGVAVSFVSDTVSQIK